MATHSSILAWEIPWTEEPGGLQSMGSQRVRCDLETNNGTTWVICHRALGNEAQSSQNSGILQGKVVKNRI